jgi:hypothetical protein
MIIDMSADKPAIVSSCEANSPTAEATWAQLRLIREKIFIAAVIAGKPVSGILDTGAEFSIIDKTLAASLKLSLGQPAAIQTPGGVVAAQHVSSVIFDIPGQVRIGLTMVAMDLAPLESLLGGPVDFILGGDMLRRCALSLDIPQQRFRLGPSGAVPQGFNQTPVKLIRNTPFISIEVSGHPVTALLDFGSNSDLNLTPEAWAKVKPADAIVSDSVNGDGAGNLTVVGKVRLAHMEIAGFDEQDVDVRIKPSTNHLEIGGAGALVGLGIMNRYSVLLDLPANRLWLKPAKNPPARLFDRSGLALAPEATALRVLYVSQGSPALENGWKTGDRICAVNGRPIVGTDPSVTMWAKGPPGTAVELSMCDGEVRRLTLKDYY